MNSLTTPIALSVVSPIYRAEKTVRELVRRIREALEPMGISFEIILVEDGGPDASWAAIQACAAADERVKGVKFTRNFGQHYAITAGLALSLGDHVAVIDCDLQDDPADLPLLYAKATEGNDVIFTEKLNRAHALTKNIGARAFELIFNWLIKDERFQTRSDVGTFSMLSRKAVNAFLKISDYHRHYLMVVRWLGFKEAYVTVTHHPRTDGRSTYTFRKLVAHAVNGITSQSLRLLHLSILLGFAFVVLSLLTAFALVVFYFAHGFREGWTSIAVLILLSTGCILLSLGVTGLYLGKVFDQVRRRPLFLIDSVVNLPERDTAFMGAAREC